MDIASLPFSETVGIRRSDDGCLTLPFTRSTHNHLGTVHASAQFALAESASGEALQRLFPELVGKVVPLLRESQVKFRKPAAADILASASVPKEAMERFREQMRNKGRASIAVEAKVYDAQGVITCVGTFEWFMQRIDEGGGRSNQTV